MRLASCKRGSDASGWFSIAGAWKSRSRVIKFVTVASNSFMTPLASSVEGRAVVEGCGKDIVLLVCVGQSGRMIWCAIEWFKLQIA